MYRSLTLSDEQEGGQLLAAPVSIPAVYDDGQTEVLGRGGQGRAGEGVLGRLHYATTTTTR